MNRLVTVTTEPATTSCTSSWVLEHRPMLSLILLGVLVVLGLTLFISLRSYSRRS